MKEVQTFNIWWSGISTTKKKQYLNQQGIDIKKWGIKL